MLQKNSWTGLLFLIGISFGSWEMGLAILFATTIGTLTAIFFKFDKTRIEDGIYGFSAALVGAAALFFFQSSWIIWTMVGIGAILATLLQEMFIQLKIPAFTFPFVLITWGIFSITRESWNVEVIPNTTSIHKTIDFLFRSYGQVIFKDHVWVGAFFLLAVGINSIRAAVFGLIGGLLASLIFFLSWTDFDSISTGLYGFNAVLCAITLAGNKKTDVVWAGSAIAISIGVSMLFFKFNLPQLTFPFVVGAGIMSFTKNQWFNK